MLSSTFSCKPGYDPDQFLPDRSPKVTWAGAIEGLTLVGRSGDHTEPVSSKVQLSVRQLMSLTTNPVLVVAMRSISVPSLLKSKVLVESEGMCISAIDAGLTAMLVMSLHVGSILSVITGDELDVKPPSVADET